MSENRAGWVSKEQRTWLARRARKLVFPVGLISVILAGFMCIATFLILANLTPILPTHNVVVTLWALLGSLVFVMLVVIAVQLGELVIARRRGDAASRLHLRIIGLFSVIAVLPAIVLAIFATISLDRGLDHWFSSRTQAIISSAIDVGNSYLDEHAQVLRSDILALANDLEANASQFQAYVNSITGIVENIGDSDPARFGPFLTVQSSLRALPGVYLIDRNAKILSKANEPEEIKYVAPKPEQLTQAEGGRVVLLSPENTNLIGAIKRISKFEEAYLYVVRSIDPKVIAHMRNTSRNVTEYSQMEKGRAGIQVAFGLLYLAIAVTLLLAALWLGLWFANRLVAPIRRLISAADTVSTGDLDVQVKVKSRDGDLGQLSSTFNNMVSVLKNQRTDLLDANTMLNDRRLFMEAVLSGVSAGIIGVNNKNAITIVNRSAETLLAVLESDLLGQQLAEISAEFADLHMQARANPDKLIQDQIAMMVNGVERTFAVRVTREESTDEDHGYIVTFDDITELVTAQRSSAWADIARRIAHEIKNPLTPIQLSAERIRRKYSDAITEDRDIFEQCTQTIIRQVGDIGRMVDEFSSFARMPKPVMEPADIRNVVRDAVFLFKTSNPEISYEVDLEENEIKTLCDQRLLSQAVTNLIKNAGEAIATRMEQTDSDDVPGKIRISVAKEDENIVIAVVDNGCGLPNKERNRLFEPYMTTREKGTGLGLAIVQKIAEQHGGRVVLEDAPKENGYDGGACVRLVIPLSSQTKKTPQHENQNNSGESLHGSAI